MLRTRLLVGSLLILGLIALAGADASVPAVALGSSRIDGVVLIFACVFAFATVLSVEFSRLTDPSRSRQVVALNYFAIVGGIASVCVLPHAVPKHLVGPLALTVPLLLVFAAGALQCRFKRVDGFAQTIGATLLGYAVIGLPLGFWILLRQDRDAWTLAGAILCVKSADIGAYFTGIAIGRHKMIPWLSPGKSWEGLAGGVVLSGLVGAGLAWVSSSEAAANRFVDPVAVGYGVIVALVLGLIGTCGDLFESLLKRGAGVKDSGALLPGMGGLYDVFDSLLLAGPFAWWLLAN